jgi:hypothetical protein
MRAVPVLLLLLLAPSVLPAGDTYTWVDENNERHWSDTPHPGAQKVELQPQGGYTAAPPPPVRATPAGPAGPAGAAYQSCSIAQPTEDQVYFDIDALTISVQLTPGRRPGDVVAVTLDGNDVAPAASGLNFTVSPIDRGTHVAAATVRDASGRTLCTATPVTFHVRQHSVARPP